MKGKARIRNIWKVGVEKKQVKKYELLYGTICIGIIDSFGI